MCTPLNSMHSLLFAVVRRKTFARLMHQQQPANHTDSASPSSGSSQRQAQQSLSSHPMSSTSSHSTSSPAWSESHASHYTPLSPLQRSLLFVGSSALALLNPHRGDLVAAVSELSGPLTNGPLRALHARMESSDEGRQLLNEKPRVTTATLNLETMRETYSQQSFGYAYACFMLDRCYSPDERSHVKYVSDPSLSYVLQRYREIHDFLHILTGMPTSVMGELGQKAFEAAHFRLTMPALSALVAPHFTLTAAERHHYSTRLLPWARQLHESLHVDLIAMRYESYMNEDLAELRRRWGFIQPPTNM